MRTTIFRLTVLLIPAALAVSCRSSRSAAAQEGQGLGWQKQPLTIDGSDSDWVRPLPGIESTEKLTYAMTNDAENLYVMISTKDPAEQNKILSGGMTVWVNNQADKTNDEAIGLGFPLDPHNDREKQLMAEARPEVYKDRSAKLDDADAYELYGFSREEPIARYNYGVENKQGVVVRMNYNASGDLVYEAQIPLKAVFPKANNSHYYAGRNIAVGIFIEGIPAPPGSRGGGGGGGVSIGGGLGFGSFGSGGGVGLSIGTGSLARIGGGKGAAYKPKKIWHVMTLEKAPARPF
ncbi:hypothetical protein Q4E93_29220 [Flavitalea sp. BT771]|uniref:hypothetical protein n=1 Tax=Flavitalea sp. BT771 TaxID=3063329 RepID=UPI0026E11EB1|nr:hypothetical protein [Flavitalea sp. BT771]MDO6434728.1 hypothetical protein [Flavitalea sp. BT771]MDV6223628.1 hypothetical protein [Flavitalea sp. BT771]